MSENLPVAEQKQPAPGNPVKRWVEDAKFQEQIARALPSHVTTQRFIRSALTSLNKTPKLLDCTVESVTGCLLQCAQYGIEPDGRRAHLIPYGKTCTLVIDYKGLVELALRSQLVSYIHADVVRDGDVFEYSMGEVAKHVPWFLRRDEAKPAEPGADYAVYALAKMKGGSVMSIVMSIQEVMEIRDRSQGFRAFKAGKIQENPWDENNWVSEQEMIKKTAIRRLCKLLPLSPEFRDAAESEDQLAELRNVTPKPSQLDVRPLFAIEAEPKQEGGAS